MLRLAKTDSQVGTMGEVASSTFDNPVVGRFVEAAVYGYTFLGQASYLLVLGTSLQKTFYKDHFCIYAAAGAGCIAVLPALLAIRNLGDSVWICFANTLLIVMVVVLALATIASETELHAKVENHMFAPGLGMMQVLGGVTNITYSFAGQWMYFELMDVMDRPSEFLRAFSVVIPLMVGMYLAVAMIGYALGARGPDLIENVGPGRMLQSLSVMLFVHVGIVYLIKSIVLSRYLQGCFSPATLDNKTLKGYSVHGVFAVLMLLIGYLIANVIPFFSQLLGLIGGFFAGPINFILPIVFYLAVLQQTPTVLPSVQERLPLGGVVVGVPTEDATQQEEVCGNRLGTAVRICDDVACFETVSEPGPNLPERQSLFSVVSSKVPFWEKIVMFITITITLMTMVFGVADQVNEVVRLENRFGPPFSCHPYEVRGEGGTSGLRTGVLQIPKDQGKNRRLSKPDTYSRDTRDFDRFHIVRRLPSEPHSLLNVEEA